jgi:signal transduction histidine kinase
VRPRATNVKLAALLSRHKLGLAFGSMLAMSFAAASIALFEMANIQRHLGEIVEQNNAKLRLTHEMSEAVHIVSRVVPKLVLLHDATEIDIEASRILAARRDYDTAWANLQALPADAAGHARRAAILSASQVARALNDNTVELARAGRDAEATVLLHEQAAPAVQVWQDAIAEKIVAEDRANAAHYEQARRSYRDARNLLIGVNVFSVAMGLLFGWVSRGALVALARSLKERDELIGMLAHEVAQPLNNASAAIEAAASAIQTAGILGADAAAPLQRAQSVLGHVVGSLNNTLAAAKLVTEERDIAVQDTDIDTVIGLALADLDAAGRRRVSINRIGQTRTATMNSGLVRLALRNLLVNALKYSPSNSPVELNVLDSDEPLALVLEVRDRGSGIAPQWVPRVFERGVRGPQAAQAGGAATGLGLGLYIVARVAALHRGTIQVLDNQPHGAVLRFVLPQAIFN